MVKIIISLGFTATHFWTMTHLSRTKVLMKVLMRITTQSRSESHLLPVTKNRSHRTHIPELTHILMEMM